MDRDLDAVDEAGEVEGVPFNFRLLQPLADERLPPLFEGCFAGLWVGVFVRVHREGGLGFS